jgi:hypothetical protein
MTIVSAVTCSALIISFIALSDILSVIVICVIYGYFYGVCMFHTGTVAISLLLTIQVVALSVPLITVLTPDLSELGLASYLHFYKHD